jgi:hypothetical protein
MERTESGPLLHASGLILLPLADQHTDTLREYCFIVSMKALSGGSKKLIRSDHQFS